MTESTDLGLTWANSACNITAFVKRDDWTLYGTGPGGGVQLDDGTIVIPCFHVETEGDWTRSISHVIRSDDGGRTWTIGGSTNGFTRESQVVDLGNGMLELNCRNLDGSGVRAVFTSHDQGVTWPSMRHDMQLIEPLTTGCPASIISGPIQDARKRTRPVLFSNPSSSHAMRMTVRQSDDQGQTWTRALVLHETACGASSLATLSSSLTADVLVACLFECGERDPDEHIQLRIFMSSSMPQSF